MKRQATFIKQSRRSSSLIQRPTGFSGGGIGLLEEIEEENVKDEYGGGTALDSEFFGSMDQPPQMHISLASARNKSNKIAPSSHDPHADPQLYGASEEINQKFKLGASSSDTEKSESSDSDDSDEKEDQKENSTVKDDKSMQISSLHENCGFNLNLG